MNDYNRIAWAYDVLARWMFRGNILKSQTHFIWKFKAGDRILIIGGGSGEVLTDIEQLNIPLIIDFVEPSGRMIHKASKRIKDSSNLIVNFHQTSFELFQTNEAYGIVCCFFFMDLFKEDTLGEHLNHINVLMKEDGNLYVTEFRKGFEKWWQKPLSIFMHMFFKLTTNLESDRLKDIDQSIRNSGFMKIKEDRFFSDFIFSAIYQKEVL